MKTQTNTFSPVKVIPLLLGFKYPKPEEPKQCCGIIDSYCEWRNANRSKMAGAPTWLEHWCWAVEWESTFIHSMVERSGLKRCSSVYRGRPVHVDRFHFTKLIRRVCDISLLS